MKNLNTIFCTFTFALCGLPATAQTLPFVEEGKTWTMEYVQGRFDNLYSTLEVLKLEGDTLIAGRTWKKMYCIGNGSRQLATALYEEDGKVYYLPYIGATEGKLLYDFNMNTGDEGTFYNPQNTTYLRCKESEYPNDEKFPVKIVNTGKQEYSYGLRKCLFVSTEGNDEHSNTKWIEGIGNTSNPLNYIYANLIGGNNYHLLKCCVERKVLYEDKRVESDRFAEEGKSWTVEIRKRNDKEHDTDAPSVFEHYIIEGDTTLFGYQTWKKLYSVNDVTGERTLLTAIGDDYNQSPNNRVYYLPYKDATYRALLYDFGAKMGDVCTFYDLGTANSQLTKEDYVETPVECYIQFKDTRECERHFLDYFDAIGSRNGQFYAYMESVGNLMHPFKFIQYASPESEEVAHVVECRVGDRLIYSEPVWKEPTTGIDPVNVVEKKAKEDVLYDLSGRRIYRAPRHGVYIWNGQKHIVR